MATVSVQPGPARVLQTNRFRVGRDSGSWLCIPLTCLAILVHGYHPYAEDGGIYLAGVKYLLNPHLYPYANGFVTSHLYFSIYGQFVAGLVRLTALDVMTVLFALYIVSIYLTLLGAWHVTGQLFAPAQRKYAVAVLASALTLPVAGTSLMLVDPYVSARSLTTPCLLFALHWALVAARQHEDSVHCWKALALCCITAAAASMFHPLMGGYGVAVILLFGIFSIRSHVPRAMTLVVMAIATLGMAAVLQRYGRSAQAGYVAVAQTRTYWFLSQWTWYEWAGLLFPLGILMWFGLRSNGNKVRLLARSAFIAGLLGIVCALLFAHRDGASYAVARLQPLRIFQMIYLVMIVFLGASIRLFRRSAIAAGLICCVTVLSLFATDRSIYAHSNHLEFPWVQPENKWTQGFLWLRNNTLVDDVIAIDSQYISAAGEDAQNLRAISERSTLADFSKDGGIAAITPQLTTEWLNAEALESGLNHATDPQRISRLGSHGVRWIVLDRTAKTAFLCPYQNASISICKVPDR